jgi:hypothetical protein
VAILILVLLLMVWIVVLAPGVWRRRAEQRAGDSVSSFHRQLGVLQRAGRSLVPPAHRLRGTQPLQMTDSRSRPALAVVRPDGSVSSGRSSGGARLAVSRPTGAGGFAAIGSGDRYFHPSACKRRRDLFLGLAATAAGTGILGALPALHPLLVVSLLTALALVGYIVLLLRLRSVAVERQSSARLRDREAQAYWSGSPEVDATRQDPDEPTAQVAVR